VYGIYDKFLGGSAATITPGQLVNQTLTNSGSNRNTTRNPITQDKAGWSLTLPAGERMLANAVVRRQKVIFGSYKPDNTACSGGGQGYMTELALFSGTPVSLTEPASKPVTGIPRTPIFIEIPQGGFPIVRPGCTENCGIIADNKELMLIGEQDEQLTVIKGRQNWREIGR
jgi:Tfp pilus tip-associated adhesin PilY1